VEVWGVKGGGVGREGGGVGGGEGVSGGFCELIGRGRGERDGRG